jgi:hypothetical protein
MICLESGDTRMSSLYLPFWNIFMKCFPFPFRCRGRKPGGMTVPCI